MSTALSCPYETFPSLNDLSVVHAFTGRVPGLDVKTDRETALQRLKAYHTDLLSPLGLADRKLITAEQVHGAAAAVVNFETQPPVAGADALVTNDPRVCLGIYVADCGPVWLVDPVRRVIACVHSGRKGTDLGIVPATVAKMGAAFGCQPGDIVAQLGPCIRPPHYEIDFAARIVAQCHEIGLGTVADCCSCTGSDLEKYYSYRIEKGQTGRMIALLALK